MILHADAVVLAEFVHVLLPEPLRNEQRLAVFVRGYGHRSGAAPGDVEVIEQRCCPGAGAGATKCAAILWYSPSYSNHSVVSDLREDVEGLAEALARFVHRDAVAVVLADAEAAAHAQP